MTNDEIINLAIENTIHGLKFDEEGLLRFAKLVAQNEREKCAELADMAVDFWVKGGFPECAEVREAMNIGESIRARGQA
jgi:uncharacterized protein YggL (DUF469 family)